jgi:hypothetical protein
MKVCLVEEDKCIEFVKRWRYLCYLSSKFDCITELSEG